MVLLSWSSSPWGPAGSMKELGLQINTLDCNQYRLETGKRLNLTHSVVWGPRGAQTLRTVWFRDPETPKAYPQYGLWI